MVFVVNHSFISKNVLRKEPYPLLTLIKVRNEMSLWRIYFDFFDTRHASQISNFRSHWIELILLFYVSQGRVSFYHLTVAAHSKRFTHQSESRISKQAFWLADYHARGLHLFLQKYFHYKGQQSYFKFKVTGWDLVVVVIWAFEVHIAWPGM